MEVAGCGMKIFVSLQQDQIGKGEMTMNNLSDVSNLNSEAIKVLLIEDNPGDARLIREIIADASSTRFELTHTERPSEGLRCLREE